MRVFSGAIIREKKTMFLYSDLKSESELHRSLSIVFCLFPFLFLVLVLVFLFWFAVGILTVFEIGSII